MLLAILQRQWAFVSMPAVGAALGGALLAAGALVLAPAAAEAGGGGCHGGAPVTDERSTTVSMSNNCFVATIARVDEGATVRWVNEDEATHAVTGANQSWGMELDERAMLAGGATFEQTFPDSGVYPYYCFLHPGMVGAVVVGDGSGHGATTAGALTSIGGGSDPLSEEPAATAATKDDGDDDDIAPVVTASLVAGAVALVAGGAAGLAVGRRLRRSDA